MPTSVEGGFGLDRADRGLWAAEPRLSSSDQATRWRAAHRAALDHVLTLLAESWQSEHLVLRGSAVLRAWYGDRAREPADLDWVVTHESLGDEWLYGNLIDLIREWPSVADGMILDPDDAHGIAGTWRATEPSDDLAEVVADEAEWAMPCAALLDQVARRPEAACGVVLDTEIAEAEWTYRAYAYDTPGVRLEIPWWAPGVPPGHVRLDFTPEAAEGGLPVDPVLTLIPRGDGRRPVPVRTVTRELSLAWKILWLRIGSESGEGALGKDLYDAVLLAEDDLTRLSASRLATVLRDHPARSTADFHPDEARAWTVAWAAFRSKHPWVPGTAEEWQDRLARALESMLADQGSETPDVRVGETVTIVGGPFATLLATVTDVRPGGQSVRGRVHAFGRETVIEIPRHQIRVASPDGHPC
jgi:hypothetical protein